MTKEQLERWRSLGFEFDEFYDTIAKESKPELAIKIISVEEDLNQYLITVSISNKNLKNKEGYIDLIDSKSKFAVSTISVNLSSPNFSIQLKFPKTISPTKLESGNLLLVCSGERAESSVFTLTGQKKKEEVEIKEGKLVCLCKKTTLSPDDLKYIVTQLRKSEDKHLETQYDEKGNPKFVDAEGNVFYSNDRGKAPKEGMKKYQLEKTFYDSIATDGKVVNDRLFYLDLGENVNSNEANYSNFAKYLNETFINYEIKTCLQKLHFLVQVYTETQRFGSTYEADGSAEKAGEDFYRGRGFIHVTHKSGYLEFYKHMNNKEEPTDEQLKVFVPKIASKIELAIKSAGWYWKHNGSKIDINKLAESDDIEKVSAAINYPAALKKKIFKPDNIRSLKERKMFYKYLKEILNYDECK